MLVTVAPRCPVCGQLKQLCTGHGAASEVNPVDIDFARTEKRMATEEPKLGLYKYKVYGNEVEGQLTAEHAERIGAVSLDSDAEGGDAKSTTGSSTGSTADTGEKSETASTKARTVSKNK